MEQKIIFQRIKCIPSDAYELAFKYYSFISIVNNLKLTERNIQLVAFTAINDNISYKELKLKFCEMFDSSEGTIANMVVVLKKLNVLVKQKDKIKVNPVLLLDFNIGIKLEINMLYK